MHVDRRKAGTFERSRHFQLAVDALLAQDGDARLRAGAARRREGKRNLGAQARIVGIEQAVVFLVRAVGIVAQAGDGMRGGRPQPLQLDPRRAQHGLPAEAERDVAVRARRTEVDRQVADAASRQQVLHRRQVRAAHLHHDAEFLVEQRPQRVVAGAIEVDIQPAVAGKGHLAQRCQQAAVGAVVVGQQQAACGRLAHEAEQPGQQLRMFQIRRRAAGGAQHLRQRAATQPAATGA